MPLQPPTQTWKPGPSHPIYALLKKIRWVSLRKKPTWTYNQSKIHQEIIRWDPVKSWCMEVQSTEQKLQIVPALLPQFQVFQNLHRTHFTEGSSGLSAQGLIVSGACLSRGFCLAFHP